MSAVSNRYRGFVSYSKSDKKYAERLHKALESYRLPARISTTGIDPKTRKLGRFFRDDEELSAESDLGAALRGAIQDSDSLIVICSPRSAQSRWVNEEVVHFKRSNPAGRVFAVIVDGAPDADDPSAQCFPPALRHSMTAKGDPTAASSEPLGLDIRKESFPRIKTRLVSGILGISFDMLWRRDRRRARFRALQALAAGITGSILVSLVVLAAVIHEQRRASWDLSSALAGASRQALEDGYGAAALRLGVLATRDTWWAPAAEAGEAALASAALKANAVAELHGHSGMIFDTSFSPDGALALTASNDSTARIWDPNSGQVIVLPHSGAVFRAEFSSDGRRVLTASADGTARVWRASTGEELVILPAQEDWVEAARFSPDGAFIATKIRFGRSIRIWNAATGERITELLGHNNSVQSFEYDSTGSRIVTASIDGTSCVWDASTGKPLMRLESRHPVYDAAFSPDSQMIVTGGADETISLWDANIGERILEIDGHTSFIKDVGFSADGKRIVSVSGDSTVRFWSSDTGAELSQIKAIDAGAANASLSPDGRWMATHALSGSTVHLWNIEIDDGPFGLRGHLDGVSSAVFNPDNSLLLTSSHDGSARVWAVGSKDPWFFMGVDTETSVTAEFSQDGRLVLTSTWDPNVNRSSRVSLWKTDTGEQTLYFDLQGSVPMAAFSPDASRVAIRQANYTVRVLDTETSDEVAKLAGHTSQISDIAFNRSGSQIATTASSDQSVRIWDAVSGDQIFELEHPEIVVAVEFNLENDRIITVTADNVVRLWAAGSVEKFIDMKQDESASTSVFLDPSGMRLAVISGGSRQQKRLLFWDLSTGEVSDWGSTLGTITPQKRVGSFSPDGTRFILGDGDNSVRVLNVETGGTEAFQAGHSGFINSVSYSPNGDRILVASSDGSLWIWQADSGELVTKFESSLSGPFLDKAEFNATGTQIIASGRFYPPRIWNVDWAVNYEGNRLLAQVCQFRLLGWEGRLDGRYDRVRMTQGINLSQMVSMSRIHDIDAEYAPALRRRLGEDVCRAPSAPWYLPPLFARVFSD